MSSLRGQGSLCLPLKVTLGQGLPHFPWDFMKFRQVFGFLLSTHGQRLGGHSSTFTSPGRQIGVEWALGPLRNPGTQTW